MKVVLSGGDSGGLVVEWVDGETFLEIDNERYELRGEVAVLVQVET